LGILAIVLVVLFEVYKTDFERWVSPLTDWLRKRESWSWTLPVAILFVLSFPPLFGHEIVLLIVGVSTEMSRVEAIFEPKLTSSIANVSPWSCSWHCVCGIHSGRSRLLVSFDCVCANFKVRNSNFAEASSSSTSLPRGLRTKSQLESNGQLLLELLNKLDSEACW
jgi:hypothetical protein